MASGFPAPLNLVAEPIKALLRLMPACVNPMVIYVDQLERKVLITFSYMRYG